MEHIKIEATKDSPGVDFDFQANTFELSGKSYMEDANNFFNPIVEKFEAHLTDHRGAEVTFNFRMTYFNSSSARYVFRIINFLDEIAESTDNVSIVWQYEEDDDAMEEHGEEFGEDLEHASFEMKPITD